MILYGLTQDCHVCVIVPLKMEIRLIAFDKAKNCLNNYFQYKNRFNIVKSIIVIPNVLDQYQLQIYLSDIAKKIKTDSY